MEAQTGSQTPSLSQQLTSALASAALVAAKLDPVWTTSDEVGYIAIAISVSLFYNGGFRTWDLSLGHSTTVGQLLECLSLDKSRQGITESENGIILIPAASDDAGSQIGHKVCFYDEGATRGLRFSTLGNPTSTQQQDWLASHIAEAFAHVSSGPGSLTTLLSSISIISDFERHTLLSSWSSPPVSSRSPDIDTMEPNGLRCIHHYFEKVAREHPDYIALRFKTPSKGEAKEVTYGDLDAMADAVAGKLVSLGFGRGSVGLEFFEKSIELVVAQLAMVSRYFGLLQE